jgi:hypothetical protein
MALAEFFSWYALEPRPGFTKATVSDSRRRTRDITGRPLATPNRRCRPRHGGLSHLVQRRGARVDNGLSPRWSRVRPALFLALDLCHFTSSWRYFPGYFISRTRSRGQVKSHNLQALPGVLLPSSGEPSRTHLSNRGGCSVRFQQHAQTSPRSARLPSMQRMGTAIRAATGSIQLM